MKVEISPMTGLTLAGLAVAGFVAWKAWNAASQAGAAAFDAVSSAGSYIASPTNVINRGFEAVQKTVTGEDSFSDYLLKVFNPKAYEAFQNKPTPLPAYDWSKRPIDYGIGDGW